MPKLAIPLHDHKTARRSRRAVWKIVGTIFLLGLVWLASETIFTRNTFARYTPRETSYTILIELNQNNRNEIIGLIGEIQPLVDRGLTMGEVLPYAKSSVAIFLGPSQNTLGINVSLPEEFKRKCQAQNINITEPIKGVSLLSTNPIELEQLDYNLRLIDQLDPRGVGYVIHHQTGEHRVMSIKEKAFGYSIQTNEPSTDTVLASVPSKAGLALAIAPEPETIKVVEDIFSSLATDFVKSILHELKNHGGTVYASDLTLNEVSFEINRAIPKENLINIHNYYETGLSADITIYQLPDNTLVYEILQLKPEITGTWTQEGDSSSYETKHLMSMVSSNQTTITNHNLDLDPIDNICSIQPSALFFPQKSLEPESFLYISDSLDMFLNSMENFVEVGLDNYAKNQVIRLCK